MDDLWVVRLFEVEMGENMPWPQWVALASDRHFYTFPKTIGGWAERGLWRNFDPRYTVTEITGAKKRGILQQCGGEKPTR